MINNLLGKSHIFKNQTREIKGKIMMWLMDVDGLYNDLVNSYIPWKIPIFNILYIIGKSTINVLLSIAILT